MPNYL
jgi:alanyl-tRNA synthetase